MSNNNSEITLINMQLNVKPQKLEDMNKENSEIYINGGEWAIGFYDNLYVNGYIKKKGFIMDDWRYSFESTKIRNAQLKESREKFGKITDHFFEDCFRKFKAFTADLSKQLTVKLDEIKQAAANGNVERKKALENNIVDIDSIIDEHIKSVKNLLGELS